MRKCPSAKANVCARPIGRRSIRPSPETTPKEQLQALIHELDAAGYTTAAKCLAHDLDAPVVHLRYPTGHRRRWRSTNRLERIYKRYGGDSIAVVRSEP